MLYLARNLHHISASTVQSVCICFETSCSCCRAEEPGHRPVGDYYHWDGAGDASDAWHQAEPKELGIGCVDSQRQCSPLLCLAFSREVAVCCGPQLLCYMKLLHWFTVLSVLGASRSTTPTPSLAAEAHHSQHCYLHTYLHALAGRGRVKSRKLACTLEYARR